MISGSENRIGLEPYVLLVGGPSGVGKTIAVSELGRRLSIPWLLVDDLRLAFQRSRATLPEGTEALYFFADIEDDNRVWRESPEHLRDALIAVGEAMSPAIEMVVENHVDQMLPVIVEGDAILPSLLMRTPVRKRAEFGAAIHTVFVVESSEDALFQNICARARGTGHMSEAELRIEARAKWLFGEWLKVEAHRLQFPIVESRPWHNLPDRILAAF